MEKQYLAERVGKIRKEIRAAFDNYSNNIVNGLNPVAIQDLDYWTDELTKIEAELF